MSFSFSAGSYVVALIGDAFLIFFAIFHTIAFDELKTDYKYKLNLFAIFIFFTLNFLEIQLTHVIH